VLSHKRFFIVVSLLTAASVSVLPLGSYSPVAGASQISPQAVTLSDGVQATEVVTSSRLSCALSDGTVVCWGSTYYGVLGDGVTQSGSRDYPKAVSSTNGFSNSSVTSVVAGSNSVCALEGGSVFCWGVNSSGQLGDGSTTNSAVPVKVSDNATSGFVNQDIVAVGAGDQMACAVRDVPSVGDRLFCWGENFSTNSDDPDLLSPALVTAGPDFVNDGSEDITAMAFGSSNICVLVDGSVSCWGNSDGMLLGRSGLVDQVNYSFEQPRKVEPNGDFANSGVTVLAAEDRTACAIEAGEVFCWGSNESGALGNGVDAVARDDYEELAQKVSDNSDAGFANASVTSVAVGGAGYGGPTACAVASGSAFCWGNDGVDGAPSGSILSLVGPDTCADAGYAGNSDECAKKPVKVADGEMVNESIDSGSKAIDLSSEHVCTIKSSTVFCWGSPGEGQRGMAGGFLGPDDTPLPWMVYDTAKPSVTAIDPVEFGAGDTITLTGDGLLSSTRIWVDGNEYVDAGNVCVVSAASGDSLTCTFGDDLTNGDSMSVSNMRALSTRTYTNGEVDDGLPDYSWTGLTPIPDLLLGQCANDSIGVRIPDAPAGLATVWVNAIVDMDFLYAQSELSPVDVPVDFETVISTFTKSEWDPENQVPVETQVAIPKGVELELGVTLQDSDGSSLTRAMSGTVTIVEGRLSTSCPLVDPPADDSSDSDESTSDDAASDESTSDESASDDTTSSDESASDSDESSSVPVGVVAPGDGVVSSLVTESNASTFVRNPGEVSLVDGDGNPVIGELVRVSDEVGSVPAASRTPEQVAQIRSEAVALVEALSSRAPEGSDVPVRVVETETGANLSGLVTDPADGTSDLPVPVEDVVLLVTDEQALLLGGADGPADPADLRGGVLELGPDGEVSAVAYGLTPGALGELVVMSSPTLMGTFTVGADGSFQGQAALPSTLAAGSHTVVLAVDGLVASAGVVVTGEVTLPVTGSGSSSVPWAVLVVATGALAVLMIRRRVVV
jgi:alpha-tubulin suppressor-like RCC1 family protein